MHGLKIYTGNRMEVLAGDLARIVKTPLLSPLEQEVIVVQSRGMERWLSMEIAGHNGICANCKFPFPNTFLREMYENVFPGTATPSLFEPAAMTFKIMALLPPLTERAGFESLKAYLSDDKKGLKLFQISEKIADTFDQYLVFRPEMIFAWEAGRAAHWQAQLWRAVSDANEKMHRARLHRILMEKIKTAPDDVAKTAHFPRRVSVFGISYLPLFYIAEFAAISSIVPVNLFLMNPCKEYWADILSDKEIKRIREKYVPFVGVPNELHLEQGNRLLASMGGMGRDFLSLITGFECETADRFEAPDGNTILSKIQLDILNLMDREGTASDDEDTSLQVHACHSPMREIEVLHDNLLAMFEEDSSLKPKDILVMTPDIELYAPFIHAVFDAETDDNLRIPFSIADRSVSAGSGVIDGFMSILDLKASRWGVTRVMSLLEKPGIKEKFGITSPDMETLEQWVRETNIRWGLNAENRREMGLPGYAENTWRAGIERLLLGYAMPGNDSNMFSGILPYDHIEGAEAKILGRFLAFFDGLESTLEKLKRLETLKGWGQLFNAILDKFIFPADDMEPEIQMLRRIFSDMSAKQEFTGFDTKIELDVVQSFIGRHLEQRGFGSGFISSGVTFCAILPMRSIPSQVICLLGMNSDAFPRDAQRLGFDFIAAHPKIGDRSRRNDDRYLFLEAIVSARKKLYISYVGQSIRDNSRMPPSVLVSEVIDCVTESFGISADRIVTLHRLQAFSSEYFRANGRLFSYSRENFIASMAMDEPEDPPPFISSALPSPPDEWKSLDIDRLCRFFSHPAKYFLEKRLGIYLQEAEEILDERENFDLDPLTVYQIGQNLVKRGLSHSNLQDCLPLERAMGKLPHGTVGDVFYNELSVDAEAFVSRIRSRTDGRRLPLLDIDLEIGDIRLFGQIADIYDHGLVRIRYAKTKPKDMLSSWIYHLVLCSFTDQRYPKTTLFIGKDTAFEFNSIHNALENLIKLTDLYWKGLSKPIHFFPDSSMAYAHRRIEQNKPEQTALISAQQKWSGSDFSRGESLDPYYDLCFNNINPIDEGFKETAEAVFAPIFEHYREIVL
ncbi:MAG: exodeoxyribonuclease V subunit gamma [Deltaproteobacteria bacterium]|nr:exodeoxyribonuclease V subunit gamma [Deltaproteobacteria bacterium]